MARSEGTGDAERSGPRPLPDRARIRRLASVHYAQVRKAESETGSSYEIFKQQVDALREFTLELSPHDANVFLDMYTEESSAVERMWLSRQREWHPASEFSPILLRILVVLVSFLAIAIAIKYAV
jgi:hypothetical protein